MSEFYIGVLVGIAGTIALSAICLGFLILVTAAENASANARFDARR